MVGATRILVATAEHVLCAKCYAEHCVHVTCVNPPNNPAELHYDDLTDGNAAARGVPPQPDDFPHTRPKQTSISFLVRAHFFPFSCTLGTDEATIIEILSSRTSNERQQIKQKYKATYGQVIARVQAHTHAASALTGSASPTFPGQCRGSARLH